MRTKIENLCKKLSDKHRRIGDSINEKINLEVYKKTVPYVVIATGLTALLTGYAAINAVNNHEVGKAIFCGAASLFNLEVCIVNAYYMRKSSID